MRKRRSFKKRGFRKMFRRVRKAFKRRGKPIYVKVSRGGIRL